MIDYKILFISIMIPVLSGFLSSTLMIEGLNSWYKTANLSPLNPPSWIFGPVWTLLYILMGISMYLIYISGVDIRDIMIIYAIQLVLNFLWTPVFFRYKQFKLAFIIILIMIVLLMLSIWQFYKINKMAAYLQILQLMWLCFACYLNWYVMKYN